MSEIPHNPERVVSLVPSLTESMFDLGLGDRIVGITDYCIYPEKDLARLPRVGGVKDPRVEDIFSLQPDLVLCNQEENSLETVETLQEAGIAVWTTFPKTCRGLIDDLWKMAGIFQSDSVADQVRMLELALEWMEAAMIDRESARYFCPLWQTIQPSGMSWITFNQDTYCNDLLHLLGGKNVFEQREKIFPTLTDLHGPDIRDRRYPEITLGELNQAGVEYIILPSEPYLFTEKDREFFCQRFPSAKTILVDGTLITWTGTRLGKAIQNFNDLFQS
jgi:iron complex transport system substrate-binding protein